MTTTETQLLAERHRLAGMLFGTDLDANTLLAIQKLLEGGPLDDRTMDNFQRVIEGNYADLEPGAQEILANCRNGDGALIDPSTVQEWKAGAALLTHHRLSSAQLDAVIRKAQLADDLLVSVHRYEATTASTATPTITTTAVPPTAPPTAAAVVVAPSSDASAPPQRHGRKRRTLGEVVAGKPATTNP